jgi:hypothetical protein
LDAAVQFAPGEAAHARRTMRVPFVDASPTTSFTELRILSYGQRALTIAIDLIVAILIGVAVRVAAKPDRQ